MPKRSSVIGINFLRLEYRCCWLVGCHGVVVIEAKVYISSGLEI